MIAPLLHQLPRVLLLTGPAGGGKTSFARAFAQLGVPCLDLDRIAAEIAANEEHPAARQPRAAQLPWVMAEAQRWSRAQSAPYVIWESNLLPDGGMHAPRVLVIDASAAVRAARAGPSNPAMLSLQPARSAWLARADDVIVNEGPASGIAAIAAQLHQHYLTLWSQE